MHPEGPFRPEQGVQRGSVMDMPVYPGDPLSPGWASEPGARKLAQADATTVLKIPVPPISYADAQPLLEALNGPVAPQGWRGALPLTYHIGPGLAQARIKLAFDWQSRPLHDVIVRIEGTTFPDEWIIFGNHHDAWVNGADDPTSGAVALMETARGLSELLKTGWKPKRTIILALWDGEEWGLLGSTEWAEKHAAELRDKAAVYINSDSTGKGWLNVGGSHGLQQFMSEVAREVMDPRDRQAGR
ncbi:MAG: M28 family peptidase [Vicinamibacterales bacterium]